MGSTWKGHYAQRVCPQNSVNAVLFERPVDRIQGGGGGGGVDCSPPPPPAFSLQEAVIITLDGLFLTIMDL